MGQAASLPLKIPTIIVGLTIVAFGTSAPEAAVSITSSITGSNAMAVSNVIGSNLQYAYGYWYSCTHQQSINGKTSS